MSLHFSQEQQLSKREKQEMFRKSLDDQRRMKQEVSSQQHHTSSDVGTQGYHVPVLTDTAVPRVARIPGLEQQATSGYAPQFEGSHSLLQEKQPYMSALSEMNGRPLHVRQEQFRKESQYRNMLKDQIEENKQRKDAEKAKLQEEKQRELEELQLLQGIPAPRRQQHAEFQESPDHPLPSPGRMPPAGHNPAAAGEQQPRNGNASAQAHDRTDRVNPRGHDVPGGDPSRNSHGTNVPGDEERRHGQHNVLGSRQQRLGGDRLGSHAGPQSTNAGAHPADIATGDRGGAASRARFEASSRAIDGYDHGVNEVGSSRGRFGGESTARESALHRGGRGEADLVAGPGAAESDTVPRADYDELSSLCRELLLEQKHLRQKLEEREERERLAAERSANHEEVARQHRQQQPDRQSQRGIPRRGGGRTVSGSQGKTSCNDGGRRRTPTGPVASRAKCRVVRESALRHDNSPKPKPGVAFGSSRPRMPSPPVEKPRVAAGSNQRAKARGCRDPRVSRSEPVPTTVNNLDLRHVRSVVPANRRAASAGRGMISRVDREASADCGWDSTREGNNGVIRGGDQRVARSGRVTDPDRGIGGEWTSSAGGGGGHDRGLRASEVGGGGASTIHALLGSGAGRQHVSSRQPEARGSAGPVHVSSDGELGGESTFLAAHPVESGFASPEGGGFGLR